MEALPVSDPSYLAYLLVFLAAGAACLIGAWRARQTILPAVRQGLVGLLVTSGLWALSHVCILLSPTLSLKTFFYEAGLTVGFGTVWAWLWFCSAYSGRLLHKNRAVRWAGLAVFLAVTLTKLTNPWHGLYFSTEWALGPFRHLQVNHHVLYWVTTSVSYALALVGFFMLVEPLRRIKIGGGRLAALFGLTALPIGLNAIGYAGPHLLDLGHEPIGVAAAFALGALSFSRRQFEQASWAGRQKKPSLVVSNEGRLLNYNDKAALSFPSLLASGSVGTPLDEILPELAETLKVGEEGREVVEVEDSGGRDRYFRVMESTFQRGTGRLVVLSDITEQKLRSRDRDSRLEVLFDRSPDMINLHDAGGHLLEANPRFFEKTGYSEEDIRGMKVWELDRSISPAEATDLWEDMEVGDRRRLEGTYRRKDGSTFPVEVDIRRLQVNGKEQFMAISRDVTERKQAKEKLRRERNRLQALLDSLPTPVVRCRANGEAARIEGINPAFEETFGLAPEEAEGEDINELLVPPEQKKSATEIDKRVLSNGSVEAEVQRVAHDGLRDFQVQVGGHRPDGDLPEIYAVYTDISEQKEQERRLQQSEMLFQNAQDALFLIDVTGAGDPGEELSFSVRRVNPAYEEKTGLLEEDLQGRSPSDIIDGEAGRRMETKYRKCVHQEGPLEYEEKVSRQGEITYWKTRIAPVVIDGSVEQIVGTTRDVTKQRQQEKALRMAKEEAEEAARLKSAMLANMSHEIRTPLTSITGFADVLTEKLDGEPGLFAKKIHESSQRLGRTLQSILHLSQLEAGVHELGGEEVALGSVAERVAESLAPRAEKKSLDLTVETADPPAVGYWSEEALRSICRNLVENAIKFTPEGGRVDVRADVEGKEAILEVEDNGIGMDPDSADRLFKAFKQASDGTEREYGGTGLGLSITRRLTEELSGSIEVETEQGEGTTFTVRLPLTNHAEQ